jgi:hypothetical protein
MTKAIPDIVLIPSFLPCSEADAVMERIRIGAEFRQNYIQLYGPKAKPRLEAWYGSWDYLSLPETPFLLKPLKLSSHNA